MLQLSAHRFDKAKSFLKNHARQIEKSMYEFEFENGHVEDVLQALKAYQNEDGGFGNAMEPDFRCLASSALATTTGLQFLTRLKTPINHPLVCNALQFLLDTYIDRINGWEIVPVAVNNAPRAVWWNYKEPTGDKEQWANPNPEIIGYFHEYPGIANHELVSKLTQYALDCLEELPDKMEMHVLMCYLRLAARLPKEQQDFVYRKLDRAIPATVSTDPDEWGNYGLLPLQVVHTPQSRYADVLRDAIEHNLNYLIETQSEDGFWNPTWSWFQFEDEWEIAKAEWRGILTLENLRILRAFGRIES